MFRMQINGCWILDRNEFDPLCGEIEYSSKGRCEGIRARPFVDVNNDSKLDSPTTSLVIDLTFQTPQPH